jgi:hypothetical protein
MQTTSTTTVRSVWLLLRFVFGIVPIVAGLDKFTDILTNWDQYLHPGIASMLPFSVHTFMEIVGVIEICAGILVFIKPYYGGIVVMIWLICIALQLIASGKYFDVAVRDLVMSLSVFSMARLTKVVGTPGYQVAT